MRQFFSEARERAFFYGILGLWLLPIWSVDFFVTGDGPCHLYNSRILLDAWTQQHWAFYAPFYNINTAFDPNWLFNGLTVPLLAVFSPALAEKVFLSGYVLLFAFGFRFLVRQINANALFLSSLALLFCQHRLVLMGFYNNSLSLALWFWVVGWWWQNRDVHRPLVLLWGMALWLLLYAAHPMGFVFSGLTIACLVLGLVWQESRPLGYPQALRRGAKRVGATLVCALPALVLMLRFVWQHTWAAAQTPADPIQALDNFWRLTALIGLNRSEKGAALLTELVCMALLGYALFLRKRQKGALATDGWLLFVAVAFFCMLFPPNSISGGLEVPMRLVVLPYFALLFWCAANEFPSWVKGATLVSALVLSLAFVGLRWPAQQRASDLAKEVYACRDSIRAGGTVLVLNYDVAGKTPEGRDIANKIWLFGHVDCYIGAAQPAILSDNYEASYGYFPVSWRWQTGLPGQTDKDGINFYHRPPRADVLSYNRRTGQHIDYVLFVNYRDEFGAHAYTQEIFAQLDQAFEKIYASPQRRAILYRRK